MTQGITKTKKHSSADIARAVSLFFAVRRIMRTKLAAEKEIDPSTWPQIETLKFISENHYSKMKDVAAYLSITAPSATALIGGLIKSGFVTSCEDKKDRRTSRLMLTQKGKSELDKAIAHALRNFRSVFAVLSPAELESFVGALKRIKDSSL